MTPFAVVHNCTSIQYVTSLMCLGTEYDFFCHPKPPIQDKSTAIASFLVPCTIRL